MTTKEKMDRLLNSRRYRDADPCTKLSMMFEFCTLKDLIARGYVFDIEVARMKLGGIAAWSLRRRCRKGQQEHIAFGGQYLFLPEQVAAAFKITTIA